VDELSLVAEEAGRLVGTIRYWPVRLDHEPALLLGPVATDPTRRAVGIGRALVFESLARAADLGWDLVFLVGDRDYYRRFGFEVVPPSIVMPGEDPGRLQWRCLGGGPRPSAAGELRRYDGSRIETGAERMEGRERPPPACHGLGRLGSSGSERPGDPEARGGRVEVGRAGSDDEFDGARPP
jgi:hypothetical protein